LGIKKVDFEVNNQATIAKGIWIIEILFTPMEFYIGARSRVFLPGSFFLSTSNSLMAFEGRTSAWVLLVPRLFNLAELDVVSATK